MLLLRVLLLGAAGVVVILLLAYSFSQRPSLLRWAWWIVKAALGLVVLFAILYLLERLVLI